MRSPISPMLNSKAAPQLSKAAPQLPATKSTAWRSMVAPYLKPDGRRALMQLLTTGLPFIAIMAGMLVALNYGFVASMLLFPLGAVLVVRLFIFQHDCGHGSFFASRWANDLLGWVLGVITLTPYTFWRRAHAAHHASTGNLDRRGVGDMTLLTLSEYQALPLRRRLAYRLYRHPLVMFGAGPAWMFLIHQPAASCIAATDWRALCPAAGNPSIAQGIGTTPCRATTDGGHRPTRRRHRA